MAGTGTNPTIKRIQEEAERIYNTPVQPTTTTTSGQLGETAGGKYLTGGEGFNAALDAATNKIIPEVESRFARGGRLSSGLARTAETSAIGDAYSNLYNQERDRQTKAQEYLDEQERIRQQYNSPEERLKRFYDIVSKFDLPGEKTIGSRVSGSLGGGLTGGLGGFTGSGGNPIVAALGAILGGIGGAL